MESWAQAGSLGSLYPGLVTGLYFMGDVTLLTTPRSETWLDWGLEKSLAAWKDRLESKKFKMLAVSS